MPQTEKEIYQKKAEFELKKLKTRITTLENRTEKAEADIEVRFDQKMDQIRGHYAQTKEKLDGLRESAQDDWFDLKEGVDHALATLSEAIDVVAHHISTQPEKR